MPFGLNNAPAVFQQLMDKVLSSCRDCASTYIDDVLVYSADWEVHKKDLGRVLAALESARITAKPGKCQFGRQHIEYLGHVIGCRSLAIPEHRVTAIRDYKYPVKKGYASISWTVQLLQEICSKFCGSVIHIDTSYLQDGTQDSCLDPGDAGCLQVIG